MGEGAHCRDSERMTRKKRKFWKKEEDVLTGTIKTWRLKYLQRVLEEKRWRMIGAS